MGNSIEGIKGIITITPWGIGIDMPIEVLYRLLLTFLKDRYIRTKWLNFY